MRTKRIKNAGKGNVVEKARRKIRLIWVSSLRYTFMYKYCYKSYWHYLLFRQHVGDTGKILNQSYFTAKPNPGAGIGHQMANWIAGYCFSRQFCLRFSHIPFSSNKWEQFLGFYQGEKNVSDLKKQGFKIVRLQKFDERNIEECNRIRKIIKSYKGKKVIFLAEQDQFYYNQYEIMDLLQAKFYSSPSRRNDQLIFDKNAYNIAIHVRRGDIMQNHGSDNLSMRYQSNDYFVNALNTALEVLKNKNNIQIYLFSQGDISEFSEFYNFDNIHFCLDMDAQNSFLHMVYADALITSKSSFSYKPALLNLGLKFCPSNFWHGYPKRKDWIVLNDDGKLCI